MIRRIRHAVALGLSMAGTPLLAQEVWPDLDLLLGRTLAVGQQFERSFWLPDVADPARAQQALGIVYPIIQGAAGNTGISVGLFLRVQGGWAFAGEVSGLFGQAPRDPVFAPGMMQLTTTLPGPNDPRCCPTLAVRWQIDLATLQAQRLN